MMNKKTLRRFFAHVLALALALSCAAFAPAASAEGPQELYRYTPIGREADMAAIRTNLLLADAAENSVFFYAVAQKYTAEGPKSVPWLGYYNGVASKGFGLPREKINTNYTRTLENLKMELMQMPVLYTKGVGAINLRVNYMYTPALDTNAAFDETLRVYVSTDGQNYLPGSVGVRSVTLTGGGADAQDRESLFYEIETENLLDIPGLKAGERILRVMILPNGEFRTVNARSCFDSIVINSYATREDFEKAVPSRKKTVAVPEDTMRQIVLEEAYRTANIAWTTPSTIYTVCPEGASNVATTAIYMDYLPLYTYHGLVYERNSNSTRERHESVIVNGVHTAGNANDNAVGADCGTFAINALSRVAAHCSAGSCGPYMNDPGMRLLEGTKHRDRPYMTDLDVIEYNTEQEMYELYAKAKPGDFVYQNTSKGAIHVRLKVSDNVVRRADGTIDGEKSTMTTTEQASVIVYELQLKDGTRLSQQCKSPADLDKLLSQNPGAKVLYGHSTHVDSQYTFAKLFSTNYVVNTLRAYEAGQIETEDVQTVITPRTTDSFLTGGAAVTMSSNYRLIGWRVKLEDRSQGKTLFNEYTYADGSRVLGRVYQSDGLDGVLKGLTNGEYRLTAEVDSGPFTALGQSQVPRTVKYVDFTVKDRAPAGSVTLSAPAAAAQNSEFTVSVRSSQAFDTADVEIRFDAEQVGFVSGSVSSSAALQSVKEERGTVRIACTDAAAPAGELAKLSFIAKKDLTNAADALEVKSALLSTAAAANTDNLVKAVEGGESGAANSFNDVARTAWYRDAVEFVVENGVMSGYSASNFGPNDTLSRAMVVQVLYNKEGKPASEAANPFKDIPGDQWYFNAVRWGADRGVVAGYGGGVFKPDDAVTVEQVCVILHNYAGKPASGGDAAGFGSYSDWAEPALKWAAEKDLLHGLPAVAVTGPATRALTAQILMNYLSK